MNALWSVTEVDILAMMARPSEVPNCASVWKTAPPSACVFSGKTSVITSAATVNMTAVEGLA